MAPSALKLAKASLTAVAQPGILTFLALAIFSVSCLVVGVRRKRRVKARWRKATTRAKAWTKMAQHSFMLDAQALLDACRRARACFHAQRTQPLFRSLWSEVSDGANATDDPTETGLGTVLEAESDRQTRHRQWPDEAEEDELQVHEVSVLEHETKELAAAEQLPSLPKRAQWTRTSDELPLMDDSPRTQPLRVSDIRPAMDFFDERDAAPRPARSGSGLD